MKTNRPICPRCESVSVYFRKDRSLLCRRCKYDSRTDECDIEEVLCRKANNPVCPKCERPNLYVNKNKSAVCPRCGTMPGMTWVKRINEQLPEKPIPTQHGRGHYRLEGTYRFYNTKYRYCIKVVGHSSVTDTFCYGYWVSYYKYLRCEAKEDAAAKIDGYDWKYVDVVEEVWEPL